MKRFLLILPVFALLWSCSAAESHSSTGEIKRIRDSGKVLVIEHQEFPGFMEAMTMPFELSDPAIAAGLKEGDKVAFTIEKKENGYPISKIKKIEP